MQGTKQQHIQDTQLQKHYNNKVKLEKKVTERSTEQFGIIYL